MRVLLTGGYGCIGSWIIRNLLERGDQAIVYDLKEDPRRLRLILTEEQVRAGRRFVPGRRDRPGRPASAPSRRTASRTSFTWPACRCRSAGPTRSSAPRSTCWARWPSSRRCAQSRGQVQRLVYASSAAVFGPPEDYPPGPLADDVPLTPTTHYGYFKCCNEGNARIYFQDHGLSSIGLRPWTVYGVGRDFGMTSEPTKAIKSLALGRPYHITYGGWQDLQYVDDVAKMFVRCLEAPYQGAKSYNLRGDVVDLPTFHRALCAVDPAAAQAHHATATGRSPSPTISTTPPCSATWGRCRRRRWKWACGGRWSTSAGCTPRGGSTRRTWMGRAWRIWTGTERAGLQ